MMEWESGESTPKRDVMDIFYIAGACLVVLLVGFSAGVGIYHLMWGA